MQCPDLRSSTLVLVGHGSSRNPFSARAVLQHAGSLRRRGIFECVLEAFWLQEPRLSGLWERVQSPRVFVVPIFIGEGYFTTQAIPEALGLRGPGREGFASAQSVHGHQVHYCAPVGNHPHMTEALLDRALHALREAPGIPTVEPVATTLIVAGHGTSRNERSRETVESHVRLLRDRHLFADVRPAFMEEEPRIGDCPAATLTRDIAVVPCFISDGLHTLEDIPGLLGLDPALVRRRLVDGQPPWINPTTIRNRRIWYTPAVGTDPIIADIVLQRVNESLAAT